MVYFVSILEKIKVRSHMRGRARAEAGGKLASTQIITCVHTCAVAERWRSGGKNRSARNGSNTQFVASASKPRTPNHHCPQEMADPPASAPRMCDHTRGSGAGISKSARLRPATAPRMCERSLNEWLYKEIQLYLCNSISNTDNLLLFTNRQSRWSPISRNWFQHQIKINIS